MNGILIDTSVWIDFFAGRKNAILERGLSDAMVVLSPIVAAELLSGVHRPKQIQELRDFLAELPIHPTPREHWEAVGALRRKLSASGITASIPDAHIAQCALELKGPLLSRDAIFSKIAPAIGLRVND